VVRFADALAGDAIGARGSRALGLRNARRPLGEDTPTPVYRADPDTVRQEFYKLLAEARAAQTMPWDAKRATLYRAIFPQMTNWLPVEEGAQLRFEFETELARLEAA
jgi:hypothetical protein